MNNKLENTLILADKLRRLRCPICGKSPKVIISSDTTYSRSVCHNELDELCDNVEQEFVAMGRKQDCPKTIKIKPRTPPPSLS